MHIALGISLINWLVIGPFPPEPALINKATQGDLMKREGWEIPVYQMNGLFLTDRKVETMGTMNLR